MKADDYLDECADDVEDLVSKTAPRGFLRTAAITNLRRVMGVYDAEKGLRPVPREDAEKALDAWLQQRRRTRGDS